MKSIGLNPLSHAPCIFQGTILENKAPLYLGLYVDDFIYFSTDESVERAFEAKLKSQTNVDFMGTVTHFLGHKFQWQPYSTNKHDHLKVHISQSAYVDHLLDLAGLTDTCRPATTPYRSGYPVDAVRGKPPPPEQKQALKTRLRQMIGSLLWLSQGTRPDLSTITSMLAQYQNSPHQGHIDAAIHVIRYINQTRHLGIIFDSSHLHTVHSYTHFPIAPLHALSDSNWGPQDQSTVKEHTTIPLFKSRSISGHIIFLYGPLHWQSKRQTITARSSAEAEIYATDECVRELIYLRKLYTELNLHNVFFKKAIDIRNDNMACVQWCKNRTTRSIRHIQLRDNAVRESIQKKEVDISHIPGRDNIADIFTKEDRDPNHFTRLRDRILYAPIKCNNTLYLPQYEKFDTFNTVRFLITQATGGISISAPHTSTPYIRDT